jgi:hypothetical protein
VTRGEALHDPTLTYFMFIGVSEYLEDLVDWIDAPLLNHLDIAFFHQLVFDAPQVAATCSVDSESVHQPDPKELNCT